MERRRIRLKAVAYAVCVLGDPHYRFKEAASQMFGQTNIFFLLYSSELLCLSDVPCADVIDTVQEPSLCPA